MAGNNFPARHRRIIAADSTIPRFEREELYRAKIERGDVRRLLEIRADAVAEFQEQIPELLQADLVRLQDHVWLGL